MCSSPNAVDLQLQAEQQRRHRFLHSSDHYYQLLRFHHQVQLQMSYRSRYNDSRSAKTEIDFTSPALAVMGVEQLLFAGRAINSPANEVWPRLYIGDM